MPKNKNWNTMSGAGQEGKDMRDHKSLKPGSHDTPDWKQNNETTEHTSNHGSLGTPGGKHTFGGG